MNDSPEAATFSYEVSTTPVNISGVGPDGKPYKPTACITIDSTKVDKDKLAALEKILYGTDGTYTATSDSSLETSKTYYELVNGEYVKTKDSSKQEGKTYYEQTTAPTDGYLPLPDELKTIFANG